MCVLFLIPLIAKARASNWELTCDLLNRTLTSLVNQNDPNWKAVVACHDIPGKPISDSRIEWITFSHPVEDIHPQNDKATKLTVGLARAKANDWHYTMGLDADDLVHEGLVQFLNLNREVPSWRINEGYQLDYPTQVLFEYNQLGNICGSTTVLDRETTIAPRDLSLQSLTRCLWWKCGHQSFPTELEKRGVEVRDVPFPSLIYTVNQGSDWQEIYQRNWRVDQAKRFVKFRLRGRRFNNELRKSFGQANSSKVNSLV